MRQRTKEGVGPGSRSDLDSRTRTIASDRLWEVELAHETTRLGKHLSSCYAVAIFAFFPTRNRPILVTHMKRETRGVSPNHVFFPRAAELSH